MGLFKKNATFVESDEDIKREIRARVARQAGLQDEEYVLTGKIADGNSSEEPLPDMAPASHVTPAAVPITPVRVDENEPETSQPEPMKPDREPESPKQAKEPKPARQPKPPKQPKQPKQPREKRRTKKSKIALILFFVFLVLAFIPLYYFITGSSNKAPSLTINGVASTIILGAPMTVTGMASDPGDDSGNKVYYKLDQSGPIALYSFEGMPGPFESQLALPATADFVGDHSISFYSEDSEGASSEPVVKTFTVVAPALTGIDVTSKPDKVKYKVGDKLRLKGLKITASYENDTKAVVTDYKTSIKNGATLKKAGKITIKVSVTQNKVTKKAKFTIIVTAVVKPPVTPVTPPTHPTRQVNTSYPIPSLSLYKAGPGAADLQWNGVSGASGYQIQRRTASGSWSTVRTISSAYNSWTDSGPVAGTTYYYRICIYKIVGGQYVYGQFSTGRSIAL